MKYFVLTKKHLLAQLNVLIEDDEASKSKAKAVEQEFNRYQSPDLMDSSADSLIITRVKEHERLRLSLRKSGLPDTKSLSILSYYILIEQIEKEKFKNQPRNGRKRP